MTSHAQGNPILLTGATGFVGRRLLQSLESEGRPVRCLVRHPEALAGEIHDRTQIVRGDVLDEGALQRALLGVRTAIYLIHSMDGAQNFESQDRRIALDFSAAVRRAGVQRIVYLGGLGDEGTELSPHLKSRHEVGQLLRKSGAEVVELRASIVLGCGSVSFEMIRALVERLPVMITPRWVDTPSQPIGVSDLMRCLVAAIDLPPGPGRTIEIGGPDRMSYGDIMREYARQRGLRRMMLTVPVLTPRLSSLWLGLVTPFYARVGRRLIDSLRNPTLVRDPSGLAALGVRPVGVPEAIADTLAEEDRMFRASRWWELADAGSGSSVAGNPGPVAADLPAQVRERQFREADPPISKSDARARRLDLGTRRAARETGLAHVASSSTGDRPSVGPGPRKRLRGLGLRLFDARALDVAARPDQIFAAIERIGGSTGWYYANWLWRMRGWMDRGLGGTGLRRGRSEAAALRVNDAVDFWRVEEVEPGRRVRFAAEMKVPGRAWLEFEVTAGPALSPRPAYGHLHQIAIFEPRGLAGLVYWYVVSPIHHLVFQGMLLGIAREAERTARAREAERPDDREPGTYSPRLPEQASDTEARAQGQAERGKDLL